MSKGSERSEVGDRLGAVLHLLRLTGTLYCRAELSAPWGFEIPALPGQMTFAIVTRGRCWLLAEGVEPRMLASGTLTLLPHGDPHRIVSAPDVEPEPLSSAPVERVTACYELMRHGGGGELTQLTYGVLRIDPGTAQRLIAQLPPLLHVDSFSRDVDGWVRSTLELITLEASALQPGGEIVLTRLADILVVQAIRAWLLAAPEAQCGFLAALRDGQIGRALAALHADPGGAWSLARLAKEAGMSRSSFAARFSALMGEPVGRYLTACRMQRARIELQQSSEPLVLVAERLGYRSEAAFGRAFRRTFGVSPGSVRGRT